MNFKENAKYTLKTLLGIGQPWYHKAALAATYVSLAAFTYCNIEDLANIHKGYALLTTSTAGSITTLTHEDIIDRINLWVSKEDKNPSHWEITRD
ncbi:hypothetical protein HN924_01385 [Candidatus Woesearchaeota archaeon]|jgi:hypothetical protein|nr:hypothetical protein [Candidatus Woesearchaeota archaeon]MBT7062601.1 hypothetical protein [Candidatus Woesearchaeota archaeon]MBT7402760.1 hypothetical protein [Candidatus Woesearchaeota archaeon]